MWVLALVHSARLWPGGGDSLATENIPGVPASGDDLMLYQRGIPGRVSPFSLIVVRQFSDATNDSDKLVAKL